MTWVGHLKVEEAENGYWYISDDSPRALAGPFDTRFDAEQQLGRMFEQDHARKAKRNKAQREARKARNEAYKSCGLVRVRGNLGGVYWE
jgi:hypothetical protein